METLISASTKLSNPQSLTLTNSPTYQIATKTRFTSVPASFRHGRVRCRRASSVSAEAEKTRGRFKWTEVGTAMTNDQRKAIAELSPKMTKRCKAVLKQIICFSGEKASLSDILREWARIMKPQRADWLVVLKQLKITDHPLHLQVAEHALQEESFEANIRDYTKLIHGYGKKNQLKEAENTLSAMKADGFLCDQVTLTAFIDMYSKAGNLDLAEETFEDLKMLGQPLDKRSYGSMIMAYIRAGAPERGESFLREMDSQEIFAGSEIYKALLRAYSMVGDVEGAQRVFDATQLAGIIPDAKLCGLLINAYAVSGQSQQARSAFENMRRAGLEPSDKSVALILSAYEREDKLQTALEFLIELEKDKILIGKQASEVLVGWFRKLGVVEEVDLVLREFADSKEADSESQRARKRSTRL